MTMALYCRVSTKDQNLELQIDALVEFSKKEYGEGNHEIFTEKESSRKSRPVKEKLLKQLRTRELDGVVVWKLDRWGRSLREIVIELQEFQERGIQFISLQDGIDLSSSTGRLMAHLLAAFAEFERSLISERTIAGLEAAARKGRHPGRPKGSKDKRPRRKSGYYDRWAVKKGGL